MSLSLPLVAQQTINPTPTGLLLVFSIINRYCLSHLVWACLVHHMRISLDFCTFFVVFYIRSTGASRLITKSFTSERSFIGFQTSAGFLLTAHLRLPCFLVGQESSQDSPLPFISIEINHYWYLYFPTLSDRGK